MVFLLLSLLASAPAQDEAPSQKAGNLRITFLPPPMEGALSLGIYNKAGKLVRALRTEALADRDFIVGLNGLTTHWDGKDDAGNRVSPGKYSARGYCVGKLEVEGVAYHGNDWMSDDESPRVRSLSSIRAGSDDEFLVGAVLADGAAVTLRIGADGKATPLPASPAEPQPTESPPIAPAPPTEGKRFAVREGKIVPALEDAGRPESADLQNPLESAPGLEGTLWVIDQTAAGPEIKQFSASGEFLRRLAIPPGEPPPNHLASATNKNLLGLVETGPRLQRLRVLALETPATKEADGVALSTWKTLFSKSIVKSDEFASVADRLDRDKPFVPEERIRVRLLPNPLFKDAVHELEVRVVADARGSSLTSADGLPLSRFTETPRLRWAVMGHDGATKAVTIFQSDGAVVEEFRARRLANMMAFDAGEYEWSGK